MARQRDPLAPLQFIVNVIGTLFIIAVGVGGILVVVGNGWMVGAFGAPDVCATYSAQAFTGVKDIKIGDPLAQYYQAKPAESATTRSSDFETCVSKPTPTMRALADADTVLDFGFFGIVLALLWRLIRTARRRGLFTLPVARQVSALGWTLIAGHLAVTVLRAALAGRLIHLVIGAPTYPASEQAFDLSLTVLVVGFGLLTLGRVMSQTVEMRDEIDATV